MKNYYGLYLIIFFLVCFAEAQGQSRILEGHALSQDDRSALPQATVLSENDGFALTNKDGSFSIEIPSGETEIEVRTLGFETKRMKVGPDDNHIEVLLESFDKKLNELVVVGYSDKQKSELTSAVTTVDAEKLNDVSSSDLGNMLQGKVPGLFAVNSSGEPGSAAQIRLRGVSSINASQEPIYVVNGIIGGNFDPNDVESITVLKDAAATAMYGSQANGGVIVVTTKQAKSDKLAISANLKSGIRTPDYGKMTMMSGKQLYEYQKEFYRDYDPSDTKNSHKIDLLKFYSDRPRELENQNFNWLTSIFRPAAYQNYHVSLSKKGERNDYYLGVSFYDEKGTFKSTDFKKINVFANSTTHFGTDNSLTNNINISGYKGNSYDDMDIYYAYLNMPWDNPFDENGAPIYVDQSSNFDWWSRDKINPLNTVENSEHPYKGFDVNYDLNLDLRITDWLRFSSTNRLSASYDLGTSYVSPEAAGQNHGTGFLENDGELNYGGVFNQLLKFDFNFGKSRLSGMAGVAYEISKFNGIGGSGRGLPFGLKVFNVVSSNLQLAGTDDESRLISYLTQVDYNYEGKYFLTASFREDGSTAFPKSKRYGSFPAFSAAWLASNEAFLQDSKTISNLKLRASYGITGTEDIGASRYLGLYSLSAQYLGSSAATPLQLPNPNLTWESKHILNFGVDLGLFKMLDLTLDLYKNNTKNLLLQVSQPLSVGFETKWENVGEIVNKGIELGISSTNIRNKNFVWNTDLNISYNTNKLKGLPASFIRTDSWGNSQIFRNGGDLYEFYMPVWKEVNPDTGAPLWEKVEWDENGKVTSREVTSRYSSATLQAVGSALPKIQGGFTNTFRYKDISLNINFYFVQGNKAYSNNLRFSMNDGNEPLYNQIVLPKNYSIWTKPGDHATNPSPQNAANSTEPSTRYLYDASFLQLRNVGIAYAAKTIAESLHFENLTFRISADNLYTFTKYIGQDPQVTITPGEFVMPGVNDFKYPNNRQYVFSIDLTF